MLIHLPTVSLTSIHRIGTGKGNLELAEEVLQSYIPNMAPTTSILEGEGGSGESNQTTLLLLNF